MRSFSLRAAALLISCLFLGAVTLAAQVSLRWTYTAGYTVTGTSAKLTLQLPSNTTRTGHPLTASVVCPTACTFTILRNGSIATATASTPVKNRTANPAAQVQVFTNSDSTGGTAYPSYPLPSGGAQTFDLADMDFTAGERLTFALTSTGSQDLSVSAKFEEF